MSKRKRRNLITILFLLLALVALVAAYVILGEKDSQDTDTSDDSQEDTIPIATIDLDQTNTFLLKNAGSDIKLIKKDDVWISTKDPNRPINQSYMTTMLNLIDEITPERVVTENPEDLNEYGLSEPAIMIEAQQEDGTKVTVRIGDKGIDGYYALVNDDGIVYLLSNSYGTSFDYTDSELTKVEDGPTITSENIYHIEVLRKDGSEIELVNDAEHELNYNGIFSWFILKPFEEGYAVNTDKLSDFLANYSSFNYDLCIEYDSKDLSKYGLEEPEATVFVEYTETRTETLEEPEVDEETGETIEEKTIVEEKSYRIDIGSQDAEGNYYVRPEGADTVYTMNASSIDKMLSFDPYAIINSFVSIPNIETVDSIEVTIDGNTHTMGIERETTTNDEGEEETVATYYHNGNAVEEDIFKDVYQLLIGAKYDTKLSGQADISGRKPYLTIKYHLFEEDKTLVTNYYPYDESFYLVENNGIIRFLADKRAIEDIADAVIEFKGNEQ